MLVVRPIEERDIDGLLALAMLAGSGITSLPPARDALVQRIGTARASFAQRIAPAERDYLFVMEDTQQACLAGVCAIRAAVGLDDPFYSYRLGTLVHSSHELKVLSRMETLYLSNDLTGSAELCSLFLHPHYRTGSNGKLLSNSRLLFIAQFRDLFPERLIAELQGFLLADGSSPFWDHLGRHFFQMEFGRADLLSGPGRKAFIAELMPRHPLYVAYLPPEAQQAIGREHTDNAPARRLLEQEGLHYEGYVDIFDAGPVLQARTGELRAIRTSAMATVATGSAPAEAGWQLVAGTALDNFRVIAAAGAPADRVLLSAEQQAALGCHAGAPVRTMPVSPA